MAKITIQSLTTAGLNAAYTAASSGGDEFINDGHTFIHVKNAVAATNAVIVASKVSPVPKGLVLINCSVDVSVSGDKLAGFFDPGAYNDSSGCVQLTYSTHTGLTIAAISVT